MENVFKLGGYISVKKPHCYKSRMRRKVRKVYIVLIHMPTFKIHHVE